MFRTYISSFLTLLTALLFMACFEDESLTLTILKKGFEVVQQLPEESEGRKRNALYMAPRVIKTKEFNTPELNVYRDSMYAVMRRTAGIGIASNQLGKRLQIFMIEAEADNPRYQVLGAVPKQVFVNPIITKTSETRKNFSHGCLSAHGKERGNVATYEWIEYSCQNEKGESQTGRRDGFAAVIFQHEFRHLLGGTYLDHAHHFVAKDELNKKLESGALPFFEVANETLPFLIEGYDIGETIEEYYHSKN